jgi:exopolysaccharide biosynthesis polyprenyl glycosylphosphotransferase
MVKQHSQVINAMMGVCDLAVVGGAWWVSYAIRFTWFPFHDLPREPMVVTNMLVAMLVSLVVLSGAGLYKPRRDRSFLEELGQLIKASFLSWIVIVTAIAFTNPEQYTRGMLATFLPVMMAGLILERGAYRVALRILRRRGWNLRHALVVGTGRLGQVVMLKLHRNSWTGIRVVGFVAVEKSEVGSQKSQEKGGERRVRGIPVVGGAQDVAEIVERLKVDSVFVALPSGQGEALRRVVSDLEETSVDVRIIPDLFLSRFPTNVAVSELEGLPILSLRENPLAGWPSVYKRVFDIFGALFGLAVFGLPMVAIAAAVKLSDGGPVFYRQRRISYGRRGFSMLKFRTMVRDAENAGPAFAARNDPRCTRVGRWLRSTSVDELPQLFNVLIGEMSLVGPRPERPEMLEKIREEVPGFPMRLKVRAGMTGWAQVNGFRGRTSFRKRLQYDLYYLNNWSPLLDMRIMAATVVRGFRHPNAF